MNERSTARDFDWWLLFLALALCGIGVAAIFSATKSSEATTYVKQLTWVGVGLVALLVVSRIDYHKLVDLAPVLYLCALAGLVLVLFVGVTRNNTKGWLPIGGFELQVAEPAKLIIIIVLARFFSEVRTDRLSLLDLIKATAILALPVALVMKQGDTGTAAMFVPALLMGAFLAGVKWKHAVAGMLLGAMLLPVGWYFFLKPYQKQRIETFLNPGDNPQGSGYQTLQARIAVGSGGLTGKGFGKGFQNQLGFVPVATSDFVFTTLAEEWGFAGVLATLGMYTALLLRLVQNAKKAVDRSGMFLVMGVAAIFGMHVFWNVAMVIGYVPVTGIPLPLMSYGGSATLFVFMSLGLVMNVRTSRFVN